MRNVSPAIACLTGRRIEWDPVKLKVKNCPEAEQYLHGQCRKGWKLT
jgi:hypothetical protein